MKKIYDTNAQTYVDNTKSFSFPEWLFDYFISELTWIRVLDIGCWYGREIKKLRDIWFEAEWIDLSTWLRDLSDSEVKHYIKIWDMCNLPELYSESSFHGVISSASIVHMDHILWIKVLTDAYSLLVENWILFLSLKISGSNKVIEKESISTPWSIKKYVYYGAQEIDTILKNIWFNIIKTHSWTPKDDTWKILICKK